MIEKFRLLTRLSFSANQLAKMQVGGGYLTYRECGLGVDIFLMKEKNIDAFVALNIRYSWVRVPL